MSARRRPSVRTIVGLAAVVCLSATSAQAQIARVFVSVNGNDANPCETITTPCRTFAGGISRVDANGEVIVLDTGSYGGTTITKAVRINVASGAVAFAAQPFLINVPGGVVVLRGLTLKALNAGSGFAITYSAAAALHVENCVLDGWFKGIQIDGAGELFVTDSIFRNISSAGVVAANASLTGSIENSRFENGNTYGVFVGSGKVTIRNSVFSGNDFGAAAFGFGIASEVSLDKCIVSNNGTDGLLASGSTGTARISNSLVSNNGTGLHNNGGVLKSWGNNAVDGNGTNTSGTITMVTLQ